MIEMVHSQLVTLQRGNHENIPVFCVPGAAATVASFIDFINSLGPAVPIHGFQLSFYDEKNKDPLSIYDIAQDYADVLQKEFPSGPYRIVGHSLGGWIASALSIELQQRGLTLDSVIIVDSDPPDDASTVSKLCDTNEIILSLVELIEDSCGHEIGLEVSSLEKLPLDEQFGTLWKYMVRYGVIPGRSTPKFVQVIFNALSSAMMTVYTPKAIYEGEVLLAIGHERRVSRSPSHHANTAKQLVTGWQTYIPKLRDVTIPGNHVSVLRHPNVNELVYQVKKVWGMP